MKELIITSGVGEGQTKLSAFDAALWSAGIANYNLIKLSSIIPPKSKIEVQKLKNNGKDDFGNKLYTVLACQRESEKGREAWAGIGWVQSEDGRGLFVEHSGGNKQEVIRLIQESLTDMEKYRKERFGDIHYEVEGVECVGRPVCALVAAVYKSEGWN